MKKILMLSIAGFMLTAPMAFAADAPANTLMKGHRFEDLDTDKSGSVSKTEFMVPAEERFTEADANKDGQISKEEFAAQKQQWAAKMKQMRDARKAAKDSTATTKDAVKPVQK